MTLQPRFVYGTAWKENDTTRCVTDALAAGFRAFDTANQRKHYFEQGVGDALRHIYESGAVARGDLFLQTKFTFVAGQDHRLPYDPNADIQTQVEQSFISSLEHLGTEYLDSYVLHGPSMYNGLGDEDWAAWRAMESLYQGGKARALGISNVNADQLAELLRGAEVPPSYVQNRCYARMGWDADTRALCRDQGITYQGFSLLTANKRELQGSDIAVLSTQKNCTPAQLVFAFASQVGMLPLTGTTSRQHMAEDLLAQDITLAEDEMMQVEKAGQSFGF